MNDAINGDLCHSDTYEAISVSVTTPTTPTTTTPTTPSTTILLSRPSQQIIHNTIRQCVCDTLIYETHRYKFCFAVTDDRLIEYLSGVGDRKGSAWWTSKTYVIYISSEMHSRVLSDSQWEGIKYLHLLTAATNADADSAAEINTKKLRSLGSKILPRLCTSGRSSTDIPVFDLLIVSYEQIVSLIQIEKEEEQKRQLRQQQQQLQEKEGNNHSHKMSNNQKRKQQQQRKRKERQKKQKKKTIIMKPWVVPSINDRNGISLSLQVIQSAKHVVVVKHTTTIDSVLYDDDGGNDDRSIQDVVPNAILVDDTTRRTSLGEEFQETTQQAIHQGVWDDHNTFIPRTPEEVPWGKW
jgi:hypothetical protein